MRIIPQGCLLPFTVELGIEIQESPIETQFRGTTRRYNVRRTTSELGLKGASVPRQTAGFTQLKTQKELVSGPVVLALYSSAHAK